MTTKPSDLDDSSSVPSNRWHSSDLVELAYTSTNGRMVLAECSSDSRILEDLSRDENPSVRRTVAMNPDTPVETLHNLATDENGLVRWAVSRNESTPVGTLEVLANDEENGVRQWVAMHPNTPVETLVTLAQDSQNYAVRQAASMNAKTPTSVVVAYLKAEEARERAAEVSDGLTP